MLTVGQKKLQIQQFRIRGVANYGHKLMQILNLIFDLCNVKNC